MSSRWEILSTPLKQSTMHWPQLPRAIAWRDDQLHLIGMGKDLQQCGWVCSQKQIEETMHCQYWDILNMSIGKTTNPGKANFKLVIISILYLGKKLKYCTVMIFPSLYQQFLKSRLKLFHIGVLRAMAKALSRLLTLIFFFQNVRGVSEGWLKDNALPVF